MSSSWPQAVIFSLGAGLAWGFYKEYSDLRKGAAEGNERRFNPARALGLGLAGGAACLVGLALLTYLGLAQVGSG